MKEQVIHYKSAQLLLLDTQRRGDFNLKRQNELLHCFLKELLWFLKKENFSLQFEQLSMSVTLCGTYLIQRLNREYRHKNKVTDVLSFPLVDDCRRGMEFAAPYLELGDIYICREVAKRQAKRYGLTLEEEFMRQLIHGTLHLLGFDHEQNKQEELLMFHKEELLFNRIGKKLKWEKYEYNS